MKTLAVFFVFVTLFATAAVSQQKPADKAPTDAQQAQAEDISGMYTFLKEGEFVQVTVEDGNRVSGFVSRYGESDADKGTFLDQFFDKASLDGNKLTFTTKPVHGVWFEFKGTVERGPGKTPHEDAYRVIRGTLVQSNFDLDRKTQSKSRQVEFKSFPQELDQDAQPPAKKP